MHTAPSRDDAPDVKPLLGSVRMLLGLFGVLTLLALVTLFGRADQTERYFAWTIDPPLTAAALGAGYGAGCVLVLLTLRAPTWAHARAATFTILVFTILTLLATLLHLDRFHFGAAEGIPRFAAWFWMAIYVGVPLLMLLLLSAQERTPGGDPARSLPMPRWLRVVLGVQGGVLLLVGTVLYLAPATSATLWPWALTPLTARAVAAWLLAFALAAALSLRAGDLRWLRIAAVAYCVFGLLELLALARFAGVVTWTRPVAWIYLLMLASIAATGGYGWWASRRVRPQLPLTRRTARS